jgi:hypothetical protein
MNNGYEDGLIRAFEKAVRAAVETEVVANNAGRAYREAAGAHSAAMRAADEAQAALTEWYRRKAVGLPAA